jgi:hypothetical protein
LRGGFGLGGELCASQYTKLSRRPKVSKIFSRLTALLKQKSLLASLLTGRIERVLAEMGVK